MGNSKKDPNETLRGSIELQHEKMLKRCFDSRTGAPLDEDLAEKYRKLIEEIANLPGEELLSLQSITERRQAEEALWKSEEKYRTLFENASEAIYVTQDGKIKFHNSKTEELYGYSTEELNSRSFTCFIHEKDREMVWKNHKKRIRGEKLPNIYPFRLVNKAGDIKWVELNVAPFSWEGKPAALCFLTDITKRMQTEAALRESEERYRKLFEEARDGIVLADAKTGLIVDCNHEAAKLVGRAKSELIGQQQTILHPQKAQPDESFSGTFKKHLGESDGQVLEAQVITSTGEIKEVAIKANLLHVGDRKLLQGMFRDITEQKRSEEALKESEEKYRTILESIEDGYYEVDLTGNYTFFNDSMCRILGYSRDKLMGMNNREYTDRKTAKKVYRVFNKVYTSGKPHKGFDWELVRKDGTRRHVETSVSLIRGAEGRRIGFRGIFRDVTERKLAEEEKQRLQVKLQQSQRMESIGTLAGGIAHNFNNLLTGIMGNTSLMLLETDSDNPNYERLMNIEKAVQSGSRLTRQLLGYARAGRYEVEPISLNRLVKETSGTFSTTRKEIRVHQELAEELWGIMADQGQIEQVLLNLYVNAADAMSGGGDLFLKTKNITHKDISAKPFKVKPGNYTLLAVTDTGMGIDKETMKRIFDPFFTKKGLAQGTGLGLASTYGIVKGHGGYIDVESEEGHGTTFKIYLPASEEKVMEEVKQPPEEVLKGTETVLLVDDEEMIIDVGRQMLEEMAYKVLLARNGKEAIELYKENLGEIALVILDIIMPKMSGGETFDRLKEINPNIKVLLLSGYDIDSEAKEILKRGCDNFIQKPFDIKRLSQKIREILGRPEATRKPGDRQI